MATLKIGDKSLAHYFGFLKNLDSPSKKKLIAQLTNSMKPTKNENQGIDHLCGAWEDNKSAEEIILDIKNSRIESNNSEAL